MKASALIGFWAVVASTFAQETPPKIAATVDVSKGINSILLTVKIEFAEGLHGYQNPPSDPYETPVKISIADKRFKILKVVYPKGVPFKQDEAVKGSQVYMGSIAIPVTIGLVKGAKVPSVFTIPVKVAYQQCSNSTCFPPSTATLNVQVQTKR
jgi:DsbC/DsbD-like thiol-disulfide interchange protein